jgi:hypothetical protein
VSILVGFVADSHDCTLVVSVKPSNYLLAVGHIFCQVANITAFDIRSVEPKLLERQRRPSASFHCYCKDECFLPKVKIKLSIVIRNAGYFWHVFDLRSTIDQLHHGQIFMITGCQSQCNVVYKLWHSFLQLLSGICVVDKPLSNQV